MLKIHTLILLGSLFCNSLSGAAAHSVKEYENGVKSCFAQVERLTRLTCYDRALGRQDISDTKPLEQEDSDLEPKVSLAISFANKLLSSSDKIQEKISVTLFDRKNAKVNRGSDERGVFDLISPPPKDTDFEAFRLETDLYLALESMMDIGEKAILVASCQNNITRMKIYFHSIFSGNTISARFYSGLNLANDVGETRKLWVRSEGNILESARGLDSIFLLRRLTAGDRGQISVENGDSVRSAFFDTSILRAGLPLLKNHCSWR